jgi:hypothetical protein
MQLSEIVTLLLLGMAILFISSAPGLARQFSHYYLHMTANCILAKKMRGPKRRFYQCDFAAGKPG